VVGSYGAGLTLRVPRTPGPGETIIGGPFEIHAGGKGSNQAIAAARLGAQVHFLTALGRDPFAEQARALWESEGVDAARVIDVDSSTMVGVILVEESGQNRIAIAPGALDALTPEVVDGFADLIRESDVCLVQLEIPVAAAARALQIARDAGVLTVLNPAPARQLDDDVLRLTQFITPNEAEAATLVGEASPHEMGRRLLQRGAGYAVVTLGEEGALAVSPAGSFHVPAVEVGPVVDTTGAGDAFAAAFAVAMAEGVSRDDAVRWGCAAGGFAVTRWGVVPALPTRDELMRCLEPSTPVRGMERV
jgi:ribokinase